MRIRETLKKSLSVAGPFLLALVFIFPTYAQKAEATISLNEAFFDAALEAVFQYGGSPEFSIASAESYGPSEDNFSLVRSFAGPSVYERCPETIKLLKENNGVRTAVRFRDGKILVPLAFSGNYNPPLIGCVPFSGWAESVVDVEFDQSSQRLVAKARVLNVSLNGTGGIGGSVIAKLVQSSIDRKINPIEIIRLDKLTFPVQIHGANSVSMKATGIRHELANGAINVVVSYEFVRS